MVFFTLCCIGPSTLSHTPFSATSGTVADDPHISPQVVSLSSSCFRSSLTGGEFTSSSTRISPKSSCWYNRLVLRMMCYTTFRVVIHTSKTTYLGYLKSCFFTKCGLQNLECQHYRQLCRGKGSIVERSSSKIKPCTQHFGKRNSTNCFIFPHSQQAGNNFTKVTTFLE